MSEGTQTAENTVILSDTTVKIVECAKVLDALTKDKGASRQDQYYARKALSELRALLGSKIMG